MSKYLVSWNKKYCEDLGEEDEDGFLDYAYRYFVYSFYLPYQAEIRIRQYTDTLDECGLFMYGDYLKKLLDEMPPETIPFISAVVSFMQALEGITRFTCLASRAKQLDLTKLTGDIAEFSFVEIMEG